MKKYNHVKIIRKILKSIWRNIANLTRHPVWFGCFLLLPLLNTRSVNLTWQANEDSDLLGYKVYFGDISQVYNQEIYVGNVTSFIVDSLLPGKQYFFSLTALDSAGNESLFADEVSIEIPEFEESPQDTTKKPPENAPEDSTRTLDGLVYNYPNPFKLNSEKTTIRYELAHPDEVTIDIFNVNNEAVKILIENEFKSAGEHTEDVWDGKNSNGNFVAIGVYFCRIRTSEQQKFIKIAVTR